MGTLYNQDPRNYKRVSLDEVESFLDEAISLSKKKKTSLENVLMIHKILEIKRTNDLYVNNGDIDDEKMMGIGEELRSIASAIDNVASQMEGLE